jgi:tRNA G10  N-methylase Trm11
VVSCNTFSVAISKFGSPGKNQPIKMVKLLVRFLSEYQEFRLAEFESCAKAENVEIKFTEKLTEKDIFLYVDFPSEKDATRVLSRCVLIK